MKLKPRPYQGQVINELRQGFKAGHKCQMLALGTGLGKTFTISNIIHLVSQRGKKILFIVHTTELVQQSVNHLQMFGLKVGVLQGENTFITSDDEVIVATVQSLRSRGIPAVEFVVIDEAHILHGTHIELMEQWSNLPFIGMSATPLRPDLGKYFSNLVRGPSIKEATEMGYLVPATAFCPSQNMIDKVLKGVDTLANDYNQEQLSKAVNVKTIIGSIVSTWKAKASDRQTLVFATDIAHSKSIVEDFVKAGVCARHLDAYTHYDERKEIIQKFRDGNIQVLSSVNVLGIGFDCPSASCGILARPTKSEALHVQQMGRVIRSCECKTNALLLDHAGNIPKFGLPIHFEVPDLTDGEHKTGSSKKQKKDKLIICEHCSAALEPDVLQCNQCGMDVTHDKKPNVVHADGNLIEYGSSESGEVEFTHQDKREWYSGLLWHTERKGFKRGWANHKFKEKFGDWPSFRNVIPAPPTQEVQNWLKYQQIKWAKSQRNGKRALQNLREALAS